MDNILDHVVVQGQRYDIVSPTAFGDNIETIGSACINPDGYAKGSTFLARLGNEQFYYEATAAITQGSAISEGTNCKKTTVTGREAELAEYVDSLNEALTNLTMDVAPIENGTNYSTSYSKGDQFIRNGLLYKVTASTVGSSTAINTGSGGNAALADCVTKQITDIYMALSPLSIYDTTNSSPFDAVKSAWSDITNGIHIGTIRTTQYSWGAAVYKFSALYGNVLVFGYGDANIHMYRLSNGTWDETTIQ